MTLTVHDLLVAVAAVGLPGSLLEFPEVPLPEPAALDLVRAAEQFGFAGFLQAAVRKGGLTVPAVAIEALDQARLRELTTRRYIEYDLVSVVALLDDAEIECRVLDACAVAHLDYRDPDVRALTRLDLLVRPRCLGRAAEVLRRRGWRPPRNQGDTSYAGVTLVGPSGPRLVLHDDLGGWVPQRSVDHGQLWADGEAFSVGGRKLKALGSEQRLLHSSTLALDPDRALSLMPQRDVVEMVLFGDWRRPRLMDLAASWNVEAVLAGAVRTAWQRLAIADVTALSVWAEDHRAEVRRSTWRQPVGAPDQPERRRSWHRLRGRG